MERSWSALLLTQATVFQIIIRSHPTFDSNERTEPLGGGKHFTKSGGKLARVNK